VSGRRGEGEIREPERNMTVVFGVEWGGGFCLVVRATPTEFFFSFLNLYLVFES
jgi:hypothetical protein